MSLIGGTIYSLSKLASMHLLSSMPKFSMPEFSPAVGKHGGLDEKKNKFQAYVFHHVYLDNIYRGVRG